MDVFIQITFGWPAIILTILLSVTGLVLQRPVFLIVAGIICIPFTYYASNGLRNPLVVLPLLQLISAYAVMRQKRVVAWLLITPFIVVSTLLAYAVLTQ